MELLHPFVPFITEEVWQNFKSDNEVSIVTSQLPMDLEEYENSTAEKNMSFIQDTINGLRNIRSELDVPAGKPMDLVVEGDSKDFELIYNNKSYLKSLAKVEDINRLKIGFPKEDAAIVVIKGTEFFVPLFDLIDKEKERARLEKELNQLQNLEITIQKKLHNKNFVDRAPETIVAGERKKLADIQENLQKVKENFEKYS